MIYSVLFDLSGEPEILTVRKSGHPWDGLQQSWASPGLYPVSSQRNVDRPCIGEIFLSMAYKAYEKNKINK